ncbi:hypothetical protein Tco_0399171, partial [Tanacetum coccineum]
ALLQVARFGDQFLYDKPTEDDQEKSKVIEESDSTIPDLNERVIEENPESHSGSMSSMKNLDDTYNLGDQFLYDKPTEDDQEKSKVIEESDSTIPDDMCLITHIFYL